MCKCTPNMRTPWCGKGDCVPPKQIEERTLEDLLKVHEAMLVHPEAIKQYAIRDYAELCRQSRVWQGQYWVHKHTGKKYQIICLPLIEATCELAVVYRAEDMTLWSRPEREFVERFVPYVREGTLPADNVWKD